MDIATSFSRDHATKEDFADQRKKQMTHSLVTEGVGHLMKLRRNTTTPTQTFT